MNTKFKELDARIEGLSFKVGNEFIDGVKATYNVSQFKMLLGIMAFFKNKTDREMVLDFDLLYMMAGRSMKDRPAKKESYFKEFFSDKETNVITKTTVNEKGAIIVENYLIFERAIIDKSSRTVTIKIAENELMRRVLNDFEQGTLGYTEARLDIIHSLKSTKQILLYLELERISNMKIARVNIENLKNILGDEEWEDNELYWRSSLRKTLLSVDKVIGSYMKINYELKREFNSLVRIDFSVTKESIINKKTTKNKKQSKSVATKEEDLDLANLLKGSM